MLNTDLLVKYHSLKYSNRKIALLMGLHHNTVTLHLRKLGLSSSFANQPINVISSNEARCSKCKAIKQISEFQHGRKGQKFEYKFSYCNACRKKQRYTNLNEDINKFLKDKYNRTKIRARKINVVFNISANEFIYQYYRQKGLCFYTDVEMSWGVSKSRLPTSISIDKIDCTKGYVSGNFCFCQTRINTVKHDLSLEEIKNYMPNWYERIKAHLKIL